MTTKQHIPLKSNKMLRVLTYNGINREEWNSLVQRSTTGTWFQTPEAYDFFASQPELFAPFAVGVVRTVEPDSETAGKEILRAVCCGYITVEKNPVRQFFTRRAIIIGGPCLADDCTDEEVNTLMNAVRAQLESQVIYIETRNFNDYSRWKDAFVSAGFVYQPHLNFHVDASSMEVAESNIGRNRKRDIRTSFRDGAQIIELWNGNIRESERKRMLHEYYLILENLYKTKVRTPLFPESFFHVLANHPDGRFLLVGLPKENGEVEIIGGTVCVVLKGKCVYEWFACGRDGEWKSIFPSSVATYAGIRYAAEHGYPRMDMMGAGKPDEAYGVREFKARFGGQEVEFGRNLFISKPLLYKIGANAVKCIKKTGIRAGGG